MQLEEYLETGLTAVEFVEAISASELSEHDDSLDDSKNNKEDQQQRRARMALAFKTILECCGEDPTREGVVSTPMRAAKAMEFFTSGYCQTLSEVVGGGVFNEESNHDMVFVKNIDIHSLCEHHMVPDRHREKTPLARADRLCPFFCLDSK